MSLRTTCLLCYSRHALRCKSVLYCSVLFCSVGLIRFQNIHWPRKQKAGEGGEEEEERKNMTSRGVSTLFPRSSIPTLAQTPLARIERERRGSAASPSFLPSFSPPLALLSCMQTKCQCISALSMQWPPRQLAAVRCGRI